MMRIQTTCFVLPALLLVAGCAEPEPRLIDELVRQGEIFLDPDSFEPYTGTVFSTFADQPLVVEQRASLRDGSYDGPFEAYFANRQLSSKEFYESGRKHGPYEWYFDSGRLYEKGAYASGERNGPYEAYWETGELYEKGAYLSGDFDGPREWYLNGRLIEVVTYQNGVIEGSYERYTTDGDLELQGRLRAGQPCGSWTEDGAAITYPACGTGTE